MKVKWQMDSEDSLALGVSYRELGRIPHDLGATIICESEMLEPNTLCIKSSNGEWTPESYTYTLKDGLEVFTWKKIK